jgi:integrase
MFIFKRDSKYQLEYFDEDENKKKRISTKCEKKKDALTFLSNFKESRKHQKKNTIVTLEKFQKKYESHTQITMSEGYNKNIKYAFGILIKHLGPDIPINKISPNILESFLIGRYLTAKYATALAHRTLKSAFRKAVQWNYIDSNPLQKVKLPKIPQNKPVFITNVEFNNILIKEENPTLRDIYTFAFFSGCRINEILNLKWSCIDFLSKNVSIKNTEDFTTKNKSERIIPLHRTLLDLLQNRIAQTRNRKTDDYVFTNSKGRKFRVDTVSKWFKESVRSAAKETQLDKSIHFHSLRHSFASCLVQKGVSIYEVSKLLGHADIKTTQIYAHLRSDDLRRAVDLLNS